MSLVHHHCRYPFSVQNKKLNLTTSCRQIISWNLVLVLVQKFSCNIRNFEMYGRYLKCMDGEFPLIYGATGDLSLSCYAAALLSIEDSVVSVKKFINFCVNFILHVRSCLNLFLILSCIYTLVYISS